MEAAAAKVRCWRSPLLILPPYLSWEIVFGGQPSPMVGQRRLECLPRPDRLEREPGQPRGLHVHISAYACWEGVSVVEHGTLMAGLANGSRQGCG